MCWQPPIYSLLHNSVIHWKGQHTYIYSKCYCIVLFDKTEI